MVNDESELLNFLKGEVKMQVQNPILSLCVNVKAKVDFYRNHLIQTVKNNDGATTVEYALVIAVVVFGVVGAAAFMIPELQTMFLDIVKKIAGLALG